VPQTHFKSSQRCYRCKNIVVKHLNLDVKPRFWLFNLLPRESEDGKRGISSEVFGDQNKKPGMCARQEGADFINKS
jgi:hypothetical protein